MRWSKFPTRRPVLVDGSDSIRPHSPRIKFCRHFREELSLPYQLLKFHRRGQRCFCSQIFPHHASSLRVVSPLRDQRSDLTRRSLFTNRVPLLFNDEESFAFGWHRCVGSQPRAERIVRLPLGFFCTLTSSWRDCQASDSGCFAEDESSKTASPFHSRKPYLCRGMC